MKELTVSAVTENIAAVTAFVDEQLERLGCPVKTLLQVNVAIDELFGNIANYAYSSEIGAATVRVETAENPPAAVITFIDSGIPYNPLAKADPDVTLSAEEREVGGLGIYMVKKTMDGISYEYKNGQNILRIRKNIRR
ncbi:MAG: ATP-binding protein [Prevotella sp.]|nr:ATP-binding protein [Prevotella sp.]